MSRRVTARIQRTENGDLRHEYIVGGVAFSSIEAIEQVAAE